MTIKINCSLSFNFSIKCSWCIVYVIDYAKKKKLNIFSFVKKKKNDHYNNIKNICK